MTTISYKCVQAARDEELRTAVGIRQGCGLAPSRFLAFDELERHMNLQQLTTFADDYLASWDISSALQLNNACVQAGKLIDTLTDLGMQIAVDKSVILLAIGGMQATPAPKRIVTRSRKSRALRVPTKRGVLQIPICREHTYLGRKIGYGLSDRSTVMYRIKTILAFVS